MSLNAAAEQPVYYELGWSILSTIGIGNVLFGLLVAGITTFSPVSLVPIITSAAGAVANGMCYYAYYNTSYTVQSRAIAAAFGDILWMVQEAGLSFYSYVILSRVLRGRAWYAFAGGFWTCMLAIIVVRVIIAVTRVRALLDDAGDAMQSTINALHIGYFSLIALVECLSAYFLLKIFAGAKADSAKAAANTGFFKYLMRSTEVRLALLAVIGVMRAITYSFQTTAQSATDVASQLDRFAYTMECLFPVIMFIDILASKVVFTNHGYYDGSSRSRSHHHGGNASNKNGGGGGASHFTSSHKGGDIMLTQTQNEHYIEVQGGPSKRDHHHHHSSKNHTLTSSRQPRRTDSEERIIDNGSSTAPTSVDIVDLDALDKRNGISKTVEFEVYENDRRIR